MSKKEKRISKLKSCNSDTNFSLIRNVLEDLGYTLKSVKGSHFKFERTNSLPVVVPVHQGKVKKFYIKEIIHHLNL